MSERMLVAYVLNALWQVPVLWLGAWMLVRVARVRPSVEHRVWLATLLVCALLPAAGLRYESSTRAMAAPPALAPPPVLHLASRIDLSALASLPPATSSAALQELKRSSPAMPHVGVRIETLQFGPQTIRCLAWVYAVVELFGFIRLLLDWRSVRRVLCSSSPYIVDDAEGALWQELGEHMRVKLPPVRCSSEVASPVVLGVFRPVLVLPEGFPACSLAERRAALAHELAHVQRRDCLVNALCRLTALPVFWHPLLGLVEQAIARTREMICDEMAARQMRSHVAYARCLLNLARNMMRLGSAEFAGSGLRLFDSNRLEERVMRLTEEKRVLSMREKLMRRIGALVVAGAVMTAGAMMHVAPVVAQESAWPPPLTPPLPPEARVGTTAPNPASPAADSPVAQQVPSVAAGHSGPQTAPSHTPPVASGPDAVATGPSEGSGPSGTATGTDVFVDDHFAVARGLNAHVQVSKGRYLHRWVGADGEPYESADENPEDLTAAQQRAIESEFAHRMAQLDAQVAFWKSPAYIQQLRQQASQQASLAKAEAELAAAQAKFDSPEFKLQMQKLDSPEFKAQMDALRAQLPKLDSRAFRDQARQLISPDFKEKLAEAERQAALVEIPQMQSQMQEKLEDAAKRLDEASARLDAATKALAEAQKRLQAVPAK